MARTSQASEEPGPRAPAAVALLSQNSEQKDACSVSSASSVHTTRLITHLEAQLEIAKANAAAEKAEKEAMAKQLARTQAELVW